MQAAVLWSERPTELPTAAASQQLSKAAPFHLFLRTPANISWCDENTNKFNLRTNNG